MTVHRIEIHPAQDQADPRGESVRKSAASALGTAPDSAHSADVYLIEAALDEAQLDVIANAILRDGISETAHLGVRELRTGASLVEVHPLPGVMDPVSQSVESAIEEMLGLKVSVRTGKRYELVGVSADAVDEIACLLLANPTIHAIHREAHLPNAFAKAPCLPFEVRTVGLLDLDDAGLERLSREAHLFLSLDEMRAIQAEYRRQGREPRDIELETLAQTWSEHCVHKTLKSTIHYRGPLPDIQGRVGFEMHADGSVTIHNLLKSTVAAATHELIADGIDWCLSVFVDNAGVIAFDDDWAVCFKCETHNHPSAIEPYGGAATGIGGCIRDVMGTGLSAKPIAATDVFCVAHPDHWVLAGHERTSPIVQTVPAGCLHPRRILTQVVAGVRDYGNRMGIPTVNGTVWFDDRYIGNPLVYCGCIGILPRDCVHGEAQRGDHIIAVGGRTGRDGIHGATFSSAELTDTHADEFGHAVQIGNPITEKKALDAILRARDHESGCLFSAITDCGAGGFSSAVGEMGEKIGALVHLERAPLKYAGLTYTEIWISEAQERMVLAVPAENLDELAAIFETDDVEWCDLGTFGTEGRQLILNYRSQEVGRLSMEFLHDGIPTPTRKARWEENDHGCPATDDRAGSAYGRAPIDDASINEMLMSVLEHPNVASKEWIIRQYDHEVQGATVVKPLVGVQQNGPSDACVILPLLESSKGLAIANGLATGMSDDPYIMALAAIDECVRNLVCVGTDPSRIAILDNFCWPSCGKEANLGSLVRAAVGCYDAAKAYRTPFISGKDSLNNQFTTEDGTTIEIPPTLLISGIGLVDDARQCITMDAKKADNLLLMVGLTTDNLAGSVVADLFDCTTGPLTNVDLELGPRIAQAVSGLIAKGLVRSAHDCSDGGLLTACAEMAFAGRIGLDLELTDLPVIDPTDGQPIKAGATDQDLKSLAFSESASRYLLEVELSDLEAISAQLGDLPSAIIGRFDDKGRLRCAALGLNAELDELRSAWLRTLDWS